MSVKLVNYSGKVMQNYARLCKVMQGYARLCKVMQQNGKFYSIERLPYRKNMAGLNRCRTP
jgi:hypothetical protein